MYKATEKDITCIGYRFIPGEWHKYNGKIVICKKGFHYCEKAIDILDNYPKDSRFWTVSVRGKVIYNYNKTKSVCREIGLDKELSWQQFISLVHKESDMEKLFRTRSCVMGNLKYCLLQGVDLHDTDLFMVGLSYANLSNTNLNGAHLEFAVLIETNLYGATLKGANLKRINLNKACLQEADLQEVNLQNSDLSGANLQGANLQGADLRDVCLRGANLQGANLQDAILYRVDLLGTNLQGVNLQGVTLQRHWRIMSM